MKISADPTLNCSQYAILRTANQAAFRLENESLADMSEEEIEQCERMIDIAEGMASRLIEQAVRPSLMSRLNAILHQTIQSGK